MVPEKAKKRKRTVPVNSPHTAMKWFRILSGKKPMRGTRLLWSLVAPIFMAAGAGR